MRRQQAAKIPEPKPHFYVVVPVGPYFKLSDEANGGADLSYPADGLYRDVPEPVLYSDARYARWVAGVLNGEFSKTGIS